MAGEQTYFQNALSDFTFDVACGGAIRHLTDMGGTVRQIQERLDFPVPLERVRNAVWKRLTDTGVISSEGLEQGKERADYVREYDSYGRVSFRRVAAAETCAKPQGRRIVCCFGALRYREPERYRKALEALEPEQAEYIDGLPWPPEKVYHRPDERMTRICRALQKAGLAEEVCFWEERE